MSITSDNEVLSHGNSILLSQFFILIEGS